MGWDIQSGIYKKRFLNLVKSVTFGKVKWDTSVGTAGLAVGKLSPLFVGLVFNQYLFQGLYLSLSVQHLLPSALTPALCLSTPAHTHLRPLNEVRLWPLRWPSTPLCGQDQLCI